MIRKHTNNRMQKKPNDFGLQPKEHNEKAEWMNNMPRELKGLEEGSKAEIHIDLLKTTLKISNWKWWNTWFLVQEIHLHSQQTSTRNEQMPTKSTRIRMDNQRKNHMDLKDPIKGAAPNNYRPITCLPMMWKILTEQIREEIYYSLTSRGLFAKEQKGCRKRSRGTEELLFISLHNLTESKTRQENLAMS